MPGMGDVKYAERNYTFTPFNPAGMKSQSGMTGSRGVATPAVTGYNPLFSAPVLSGAERERVANWATGAGGYRQVEGNFAVRPGPGGIPTYTALSDVAKSNRFKQASGQASGQAFLDQAGRALAKDRSFLEDNVLKPYQEATTKFGESVESGAQSITDAAERTRGDLVGEMDTLTGQGADAASRIRGMGGEFDKASDAATARANEISKGADQTYSDVDKNLAHVTERLDQAMDFSRQSIQTAINTAAGYDASANNSIRSFISAFESRSMNEMAQVNKGFDPQTGQPLSAAEQAQMRRSILSDSGRMIGETVMRFKDEAQKTLAALRGNISEMQSRAAQTATAGAGIEVEAGKTRVAAGQARDATKLGAAELEARTKLGAAEGKAGLEKAAADITAQFAGLRTGIAQTLAQITNAAAATAVDFRLRGQQEYANMIAGTPYVSVFEGFMAMASLASSPGVDKMQPITAAGFNV